MKSLGIILVIVGIFMIVINGFNFVSKEKVIDLGAVEVNKAEAHPVQWSPIIGSILLVGGIVLIAVNRKKLTD